MTIELLAAIAVALVAAYYVLRRFLIVHIVATLVAGYKADPLRAEMVRHLVKERQQIDAEKDAADSGEQLAGLAKRWEQINETIASHDVSCAFGREPLFHEAWEIYDQCRRRPKPYLAIEEARKQCRDEQAGKEEASMRPPV